jgi:hypothetical protein
LGWTRAEIISALAFAISALGFVLSFLSFWRVWRMDRPHAWAEIEATDVPNWFKATVRLRNPTRYVLKLDALERESWIAAGVVIDPRAHDDGQKAAIEDNWRVGKPASIFKSLTKRINNADEPYVIEANPIVDPQRSGNSSGKIAAKSRLCHSICSRQICSGCEASWTKRCESCATTKKSAKLN